MDKCSSYILNRIIIMKKVATNIFLFCCTTLLLALFLIVFCPGYIMLINDKTNNEIYIELNARVIMVVTLRYYNSMYISLLELLMIT